MLRGEQATVKRPAYEYDELHDRVETWSDEPVENVLFGRPTTEQIDEAMRLYSVEVSYTLGIPKTYQASLRGCMVYRPRDGRTYRILGDPMPLPPEICPTPWNREAMAVIVDG